jgi:hypothetical protein
MTDAEFGYAVGREVTRLAKEISRVAGEKRDLENYYVQSPQEMPSNEYKKRLMALKEEHDRLTQKLEAASKGMIAADTANVNDMLGPIGRLTLEAARRKKLVPL